MHLWVHAGGPREPSKSGFIADLGVLELDKAYEATVKPARRGITLVPCVFAWPRVEVLVQPGYRPTLAYGPRGVANLWTTLPPKSNGTASKPPWAPGGRLC